MRPLNRILVLAVLIAAGSPLYAQTRTDPSGHWEGTVQMPDMTLDIEIDLLTNKEGQLSGTFGQPRQGLKGFPLSRVVAEGQSVRFVLRVGDEATFEGLLSPDGQAIAGAATQSGVSAPFALTRKGEARITMVPKSTPISKELERTWTGAIELPDRSMRMIVRMANQADGTASGTVVSPDGSGVEVPIAITQKGADVTIEVPTVGATYVGRLNPAGTELAGTWQQGGMALPLTLKSVASPR